MIDFKNWGRAFDGYGVSVGYPLLIAYTFTAMYGDKELTIQQVRTFYGIDLDTLKYEKGRGLEYATPAGDLSGSQWELDEKERIEKEQAEKEGHPTPA
jgi:hypothetical protein